MTAVKSLKPKPEERRRAARVLLRHNPKGVLLLSTIYRNIDVIRIRDASPFGLCLLLRYSVDKDATVRLQYICKGIQISVAATVVWRNLVKLPGPDPAASYGCWVGIFLHPCDIDANFALYQALMEGSEKRVAKKTIVRKTSR